MASRFPRHNARNTCIAATLTSRHTTVPLSRPSSVLAQWKSSVQNAQSDTQ
jgi:hypothetical protein